MNKLNVSGISSDNTQVTKADRTQVAVQAKPIQQETNRESLRTFPNKEAERNQVEKSVAKLNDFIDPIQTNLKFVFHEDLHEYYVTVVDPITNEVVREIPPKKILDMVAKMTEFVGVLVDKKA